MSSDRLAVPTLCRLEYLTASGWVTGHVGVNLLDPGRYVKRLAERGKVGRATALDSSLAPTGEVWGPPEEMADQPLAPSDTAIPVVTCMFCEGHHAPPYDGTCLL